MRAWSRDTALLAALAEYADLDLEEYPAKREVYGRCSSQRAS
jgi:hypothetical protein